MSAINPGVLFFSFRSFINVLLNSKKDIYNDLPFHVCDIVDHKFCQGLHF